MNPAIKHIEEAKKYYQIALEEIEKSKGNGKIEYAVDGCDKGWLALNIALSAMFLQKGIKEEELPKTYRGTRFFVTKYGDKNVKNLFNYTRDVLHVNGFWDRDPEIDRALEVLDDVKIFIETLEKQNK
ncbi:MAG: hypothetical protein HY840_11805 [Bacteroidetes bacterium]|nr:hypothetical protein [Bacteroidota bacterium]